ncbi:MAG: hypothetical protein K8T26_06870 [Lentisphaerae bacterium]|nr:hypothetical protein [Lentisphaerota bacterium]
MDRDARKPEGGGLTGRLSAPRRAIYGFLFTFLLLALPIAVVEVSYRFQWVDTYRTELQAYNPPDVLATSGAGPTLLALGDSFTAGTATYPNGLRTLLPDWRIINGGVSGTGIVQANLLAGRRLRAFKPHVCVYQLFVGNDLFDLRYPTRGAGLSPGRRTYWFLANHVRALGFLNYRLGQWYEGGSASAPAAPRDQPERRERFVPQRYSARERLYLAADPTVLEDQIRVTRRRADDYVALLRGLQQLHAQCEAADCRLILLIIPHAVQVAPVYRKRMETLGATFAAPSRLMDHDYPFVRGIRALFADTPGVLIVDPLPDLQAAERAGEAVYYANDGHLNHSGQDDVARLLAASLQEWDAAR